MEFARQSTCHLDRKLQGGSLAQLPPWMVQGGGLIPCWGVLRANKMYVDAVRKACRRPIHEVGLFRKPSKRPVKDVWAVWSEAAGGFGLCGMVGKSGSQLISWYLYEATIGSYPWQEISLCPGYVKSVLEIEMAKIEVKIKDDGTVDVKVLDGQGPSCEDTVNRIVKNLGEVVEIERLPEYYAEQHEYEEEDQWG